MRLHVCAAGLLALLASTLPIAVRADVVVMSSDEPSIKPRQVLKDAERISVGAGRTVRVMDTSATYEIKGPRDGTVAEVVKPEPLDQSLWQKVLDFIGTGGRDTRPGATRSATAVPVEVRIDNVPVGAGKAVTVCLARDARPTLVQTGGAPLEVVLASATGGTPVKLTLQELGERSPWPAALALTDGGKYKVIVGSGTAGDLVVRLVAPADLTGPRAMKILNGLGCTAQVDALIRARLPR